MRRPRGGSRGAARLFVLALSIMAGGIAAYLAAGSDKVVTQLVQAPTMDVLVAKSDIGLGETLSANKVEWQAWPQTTSDMNLVRRAEQPDATAKLAGSIARMPFIAGEPIRSAKLVSAKGSGFMAAILPSGKRAVSIPISPETGAGGFILPNDRVDVILSRQDKNSDAVMSDIILSNLRVLAIDQTPNGKDGQTAVIGRTATLEATPDQAEALARSHLIGSLSLALRSLANRDGGEAEKSGRTTVAIYRGVGSQTTYTCKPACRLQ